MADESNERFAALAAMLLERQTPPSVNQLAHVTRLTNGTVDKVLRGRQPSWSTVYRFAQAYPDMAAELFDAAGLPIPVDLVEGAEEAVRRTGKPAREVVEEALRRLLEGSVAV